MVIQNKSEREDSMEDNEIVELYWERSEAAVSETSKKYARYCRYISFSILHNNEDSEECVNDTYLRAWNAMPPNRPNCLATFLGKITRNLALDKFKKYAAEKRGLGQMELVLSELDDCVSSSAVEQEIDEIELAELLNHFLESLPKDKRIMFMQRYWYLMPIREIAERSGKSESQVKSALFRTRNNLKTVLEKEGVIL
jgi:RNA polymerase sigma-70 factor (ECF subfamily)